MEGYGDLTHGAIRGDEDDWEHLTPHTPNIVGAEQGVGGIDEPGGEITQCHSYKLFGESKLKCRKLIWERDQEHHLGNINI